jgi:hypothetical protein
VRSLVAGDASLHARSLITGEAPDGKDHGGSVVAEASKGKGAVLAIAIDPMAPPRRGYEFLPTAGRLIRQWTNAAPAPRRTGAEIYFDPGGMPEQGGATDPLTLAQRLRDVRTVHIAAWNFGNRDPATDFDYQRVIDALHARGILAYAWLEPPFVTTKFWEDHPACRERTAAGADAFVGWRRLMALEDAECFDMAWSTWSDVLSHFPWDGINVAELYFEPDTDPDHATPFHPSALGQFGRDPKIDRTGFRRFRTDLVAGLNQKLFNRLNGLSRAGEMDFELTAIDDRLDPEVAAEVGSDVNRLAATARAAGASLQVEDPFTQWSEPPSRYDRLSDDIAPLMYPGQTLIDITVVPRADTLPTSTMTGAEFDLAIMAASRRSGRVAIYSARTVAPEDLANVPSAMAGTVPTIDDVSIRTPWAVTIISHFGAAARRLRVDGHPWPVAASGAVIPAGAHRLAWTAGRPIGPGLSRFTGELGSAQVTRKDVQLNYDSRPVAFAVFDRGPTALEVDGRAFGLVATPNPGGGFTVRLPPGTHKVRIHFQ